MSKVLESILNRPVNLKGLIDKIAFDPEDLEHAALEQPGLYLEASRYRTLKMRKKNSAYVTMNAVKARLGLSYRKKKRDGQRLTEGAVKDAALFDPEMVSACKGLDHASEEEEWAKALVEVFRQRLSVIKVLTEIRVAEISNEIREVKNKMAVDSMHNAAAKARDKFRHRREEEEEEDGIS